MIAYHKINLLVFKVSHDSYKITIKVDFPLSIGYDDGEVPSNHVICFPRAVLYVNVSIVNAFEELFSSHPIRRVRSSLE